MSSRVNKNRSYQVNVPECKSKCVKVYRTTYLNVAIVPAQSVKGFLQPTYLFVFPHFFLTITVLHM